MCSTLSHNPPFWRKWWKLECPSLCRGAFPKITYPEASVAVIEILQQKTLGEQNIWRKSTWGCPDKSIYSSKALEAQHSLISFSQFTTRGRAWGEKSLLEKFSLKEEFSVNFHTVFFGEGAPKKSGNQNGLRQRIYRLHKHTGCLYWHNGKRRVVSKRFHGCVNSQQIEPGERCFWYIFWGCYSGWHQVSLTGIIIWAGLANLDPKCQGIWSPRKIGSNREQIGKIGNKVPTEGMSILAVQLVLRLHRSARAAGPSNRCAHLCQPEDGSLL